MTDILITDYHCASNRGDAAILEGELAAFDELFPDADVTVLTDYPESAELLHGVNAINQSLSTFNPNNVLKNGAIAFALFDAAVRRSIGRGLPGSKLVRDKLRLQPYVDADVVVSTGGQFITAAYYPNKLAVLAEWYLAKLLDKPLIIYAQSLGPFESPYRAVTQKVMNKADLIITRDRQSKKHLDDIGVTTHTHVGVDAAWTMPLDGDSRPLETEMGQAPSLPAHPDGPLISISAREWPYFDTENGQEQYEEVLADTAAELIESENAEIVFLSTCTGLAGYHTDDRVVASSIRDRMGPETRSHARIISEEMTPRQLVSLYDEVDLHIGTRMHSCILSLMAETPPVPIEYQFKTGEMMSQFGLEDLVVNIDGIRSSELQDTVARALEDRSQIEQRIETRLPEIQERAWENGQVLRDCLAEITPDSS